MTDGGYTREEAWNLQEQSRGATMTQADDIDTLNQASMRFMSDANVFAMTQPNLVVTHKAFAILCRVVSSLMAGEGEKEPGDWSAAFEIYKIGYCDGAADALYPNGDAPGNLTVDSACISDGFSNLDQALVARATPSSGEFERGRNEAIDEAWMQAEMRLRVFGGEPTTANETLIVKHIMDAIAALRKPAQEEVK